MIEAKHFQLTEATADLNSCQSSSVFEIDFGFSNSRRHTLGTSDLDETSGTRSRQTGRRGGGEADD